MTSILAFFVLICVLVFVHEYGHFWAARKCGVKVIRFSIGFGKVLWRRKDKHGTEFAFSLIPLGGYVQMFNGESEYNLPAGQSLNHKTVLQRAFIVIAGPMANFLFAIFAYWAVFSIGMPTLKPVVDSVVAGSIADKAKIPAEFEFQRIDGRNVQDWEETILNLVGKVGSKSVQIEGKLIGQDLPISLNMDLSNWQVEGNKHNPLTTLGIKAKNSVIEPTIKSVVEHSAADNAGIKAGDKILTINYQPFDWRYLIEQVQTGKAITLELVQQREGTNQLNTIVVIPEKTDKGYLIGIQPNYQPLADIYRTILKYDIFTAFAKSLEKVLSLVQTILQFIGNLITGELSLTNMSGPISMAKGAAATVDIGLIYYLGFMALISVNLGVMNLFPILPLDGGQLLLLGCEAMRGKPLAEKTQQRFQQIGIAFVLSLMAFAFFNDLIHF